MELIAEIIFSNRKTYLALLSVEFFGIKPRVVSSEKIADERWHPPLLATA